MALALYVVDNFYQFVADGKTGFKYKTIVVGFKRRVALTRIIQLRLSMKKGMVMLRLFGKILGDVLPVRSRFLFSVGEQHFSKRLKNLSRSTSPNCTTLDGFFVWDGKIDNQLAEDDGIWLSDAKQEVVLKVRAEVAGYFKRRKLISNQVLEKELEDGGLIISAKIGHTNQILPILRYWIPHIRIISPEELQVEVDNSLNEYLGKGG